MSNIIILKKIVRAVMLISVGIWVGLGLPSVSERIASAVDLGVFFLIPICAIVTIWFYSYDRKAAAEKQNGCSSQDSMQ